MWFVVMNLVERKSTFMKLQSGESMSGYIVAAFILVVGSSILMSIVELAKKLSMIEKF